MAISEAGTMDVFLFSNLGVFAVKLRVHPLRHQHAYSHVNIRAIPLAKIGARRFVIRTLTFL